MDTDVLRAKLNDIINHEPRAMVRALLASKNGKMEIHSRKYGSIHVGVVTLGKRDGKVEIIEE